MSTHKRRLPHVVKDTRRNAYHEARIQTGQTLAEWAVEVGAGYATVRKWESSERDPALKHQRMMAWISRGMFVINHGGVSWEPDPIYVTEVDDELRPVLNKVCAQCKGPLPVSNLGGYCGVRCLEDSEIAAIDRTTKGTE